MREEGRGEKDKMKKEEVLKYLNWVFGPDGTFCDLGRGVGEINLERLIRNYEYLYNPYGLYDQLFEKKREKGREGINKEELEFICHLSSFWSIISLRYLNFFLGIYRIPELSEKEKNILIELSFRGSLSENELRERMVEKKINLGNKEKFYKLIKKLEKKGYLEREISKKKKRIGRRYHKKERLRRENSQEVLLHLNYYQIMRKIFSEKGIKKEEKDLEEMLISPKAINVTKQIENLKKITGIR